MNTMHLIIFLLFLSTTQCYNILCLLPYHGKSHHMVFEPLLEELTNRGHNLTVVSFFPPKKLKENRRDVSLVGLAPLNIEVLDLSDVDAKPFFGLEKLFADVPVITGLAQSNLELCKKLLYSDILKEFVEGQGDYDVILVEHFNSDCMLGLVYNYGLPSIGLMSCAFLPWTPSRLGAPDNPSYVPGMTVPFTDHMSFFERIENMMVLYFYMWWYEINVRWEEQKLLERRLGRKLPLLTEVAENTSVVLVNTHHTLNGVRVMPPSFVEVGGIHLYNKTVNKLPEDLEKWISEAEDGFILFSFGSLIRGSTLPPKRLNAILNVFAGLSQRHGEYIRGAASSIEENSKKWPSVAPPLFMRSIGHFFMFLIVLLLYILHAQRVVWKWEAETVDNLPPNVRIMKWLPQYDLLHHPKCVAFITHAGLLSLTEAVSAGVPIIAVAVIGDQFGNAAHARTASGASVLRLIDVDEHTFRTALLDILTDEKRKQAQQLSQKWKDRPLPPMDTAIFYIEQTARHKGLQMSSHARRLNIVQFFMIDVIAFFVGIIFAAILFVKCLCGRSRPKEKIA